MSWFLLLLYYFTITFDSEVSSQDCRTPMAASKLRQDIFCGYDRSLRPVKNINLGITIELQTQIRFLLFNEYSDQLYINSRMVWTWTDEFLTWSPDRYGGIKTIPVSASSIWVPDLSLYHDGVEEQGHQMLGSSKCMLENSGRVRCMPSVVFPAYCSARTAHWPFMRAQCTWYFSSWMYFDDHLNISLLEEGIDLRQYQPNTEWELVIANVSLYKAIYPNGTLPYLEYYAEVLRHSSAHEATVLIPAIATTVLTLLVFCLPAESTERLALGCFSVFLHCFYLQHLGYELPLSPDEGPTILNFFLASLIISAASLALTALSKWMRTTIRPPPQWFTRPADWVLRAWRLRRQLQRLLPEDDDVGEEATESAGKEAANKLKMAQAEAHDAWCLLATILDVISFSVVGIVLGVMLNLVFHDKYRA